MASYTQTDVLHPHVTLLPDTETTDVTKVGDGEDGEEGEQERKKWSRKTEYMLSVIGYCVGLGNLLRFPYMCNRNGGGAFLIPFLVSLVLCGLPLFFLEVAIGQFTARSPLHCWAVCPLAKGIGMAMFVASVVCFWYLNSVLAWTLYYLVMSCRSPVPWSRCDQWWNTPRCADFSRAFQAASTVSNDTFHWSNDTYVTAKETIGEFNWTATSVLTNVTGAGEEPTGRLVSSAEEFWQHNVLQVSSTFHEIGHLVWYLVVGLALTCFFMFLALIKGVRTSGKVVYVTAVAPYIILTVLLVRGATLPGAADGVLFYLKPDFNRILEPKVWVEAALQVFYSLGPAWGGIITMASYNKFNNNCLRDSIILTFVCEGTSLYGGFAIFSVLGYMAHESGVPIDKVVSSGPGLAFVVYPEAISRMHLPQLWAVLFFIMIFTLCVDSQLASGETVMTVLCDAFPSTVSRHRMLVTGVICAAAFVLGLPFVCQGGIYVFQLVDWFVGALSVIIIGFLECVVLAWVYGADQFGADIQMMIGRKPPLVMKILWLFVTPVCLMVMFVFTLMEYRPPTYGSYQYDVWGSVFGWFIALLSLVPVPLVAVYQLYTAQGSLLQRLRCRLTPDDTWGPPGHKERDLYRKEKAQRAPRRHWTDVIRN